MFKILLMVMGVVTQGPQLQTMQSVRVFAKSKVFVSAESCAAYIKNNGIEILYAAHSRGRQFHGLKYRAACYRDESGEVA